MHYHFKQNSSAKLLCYVNRVVDGSDTEKFTNKIWLYKSVVLVLIILVVLRLFHIQILNSYKYKIEARNQQLYTNKIESKRGDILSNDGYKVVTNVPYYQVVVSKKQETDLSNYKAALSKVIGRDSLLEKKVDRFILNEEVTVNEKKLEELNMSGLSFVSVYKRFYPENDLLSHVLGFVGKDKNGKSVGYYGVEQYYNGDLSGVDGSFVQIKTASGTPIVNDKYEKIDPKNGSTLVLTINRDIQYMVENMLEQGMKKYNFKSGTVIIVNSSNGEIISMANSPKLDLDKPNTETNLLINNAISSIYEPGSVMKPITMAIAYDTDKVNFDSTYNDDKAKYFSGHLVDNWDGKHHGIETMTSILQHSNNLGIAWVGTQIGDKNLIKYLSDFGFGEKTFIDVEGEEVGIMNKLGPLKEIELANYSFGQGIAATPIQMVMAYCAIANEGKLMRPFLVKKIINGKEENLHSVIINNRPITTDTANIISDMLVKAVAGGEAKFFVSKKFNVAGKTGTAQIAGKGGYDKNRTNATFIGFIPKYKNIVMLVKLEEPKNPSGYAAETAVPLWMNIIEQVANYMGFYPDK